MKRELCLPLLLPAGTPEGAVRRLILFGGSLGVTPIHRTCSRDGFRVSGVG